MEVFLVPKRYSMRALKGALGGVPRLALNMGYFLGNVLGVIWPLPDQVRRHEFVGHMASLAEAAPALLHQTTAILIQVF